jgi:hypothetical protein
LSRAAVTNVYVSAVTVGLGVGTQMLGHSFDAAVLSSGQLNSAVSGGSSVTLSGLGFGSYDLSATAALSEAACGTSAWTSATTVGCLSRAAVTNVFVSAVTVGLGVGTQMLAHICFSFDGKSSGLLARL